MPGAVRQPTLTEPQLNALWDILIHHAVFQEVADMKYEYLVQQFGAPFVKGSVGGPSPFPIFYTLASRFIQKDLIPEVILDDSFELLSRLCKANLSESYDKGFMGLRKTGAALTSAVLETMSRYALSGWPRPAVMPSLDQSYNRKSAVELEQAWYNGLSVFIYGNGIDHVFDTIQRSADLADLGPTANAALDFLLIQAAHIMHHLFVVMPDGQAFLKTLDLLDTLIPYQLAKQVLRHGDVSHMTSGMTKILLADVGGKSLMKTMISKAVGWDISSMEKRAHKIEKDKSGPGKEMLAFVGDYVDLTREQQAQLRKQSQTENRSIISVILDSRGAGSTQLNDEQHELAIEYLACRLSIHDRESSIDALCKQTPDILAEMVKAMMQMDEPVAQELADNKFDFGCLIKIMKSFLDDLLKTAKVKKDRTPSIEDFCAFLTRQKDYVYPYLHDAASKSPKFSAVVKDMVKQSILLCHQDSSAVSFQSKAGNMGDSLMDLFDGLPPAEQQAVRQALDAHAKYQTKVRALSTEQCQQIIDGHSKTLLGPGLIIPRFHSLLDSQLITPGSLSGPVRSGKEVKFGRVKKAKKKKGLFSRKGEDGEEGADIEVDADSAQKAMEGLIEEPNVQIVVQTLSGPFKKHLQSEATLSMGRLGL